MSVAPPSYHFPVRTCRETPGCGPRPTATDYHLTAMTDQILPMHILLTNDEILRQYDRYNASAALDADSQKVFSTVLDAIESLRAQADAGLTHPASFQP